MIFLTRSFLFRRAPAAAFAVLRMMSTHTDNNFGTSNHHHRQSVAVIGSGAVGCYYGARLSEAGHSVKFLMRSDYAVCQEQGLHVTSILGNITIPPHQLQAYNCTKQMGSVDWILVCLKTTSLLDLPSLLQPLLLPVSSSPSPSSSTTTTTANNNDDNLQQQQTSSPRVILIMNGLQLETTVMRLLKEHNLSVRALYGGMAFLCANRLGPGSVDHSYAGLLAVGQHYEHSNEKEDPAILQQLWSSSRVTIQQEPWLLRGRWKKMLWNLPFNGISVAMGGITVDQIVQTPSLRALAWHILKEAMQVANADLLSHHQQQAPEDEPLALFTTADLEYMMSLSDKMEFAYKTSTMLDLTHRQPMEVQYLFQTPLQRAKELKVAVPHLETIVAQIEGFQTLYNL
jgi:2-dehydropantoate 2-reductase